MGMATQSAKVTIALVMTLVGSRVGAQSAISADAAALKKQLRLILPALTICRCLRRMMRLPPSSWGRGKLRSGAKSIEAGLVDSLARPGHNASPASPDTCFGSGRAGSPRTSKGAVPCRRDRACRTSGKQGAALLLGTAGVRDECHSNSRPRASGSSTQDQPRGRCRCRKPLPVRANRSKRRESTIGSAGCQASWMGLIGAKAVCSQRHLRTM
jgi:hypothetical protein